MSSESLRTHSSFVPVSGRTRVVGVFGHPVEHSLSPVMHNAAFAALHLAFIYVPFAVTPENLGQALCALPALGIAGVNLTIPHKQSALPFLAGVTPEARDVGAVNTIWCEDGRLHGDNTDGRGFLRPLTERGTDVAGSRAFVLGAGGAARSVAFALARAGARVTIANRTTARAAALAEAVSIAGQADWLDLAEPLAVCRAIEDSALVVQTTRAGMWPETGDLPPLPLEALHGGQLVYDLVYNPVKTALLAEAEMRGCDTLGGVKMLVYQGAAAFERWTGVWPPVEVMEQAVIDGLTAPK